LGYRIKLSNRAVKFIEKSNAKLQNKIKETLKNLADVLDKGVILSPTKLNIKKLKGEWQGFYRIRISGNIRIIFEVDKKKKEILVYGIDFRGKIYK